MLRRMGYVVGAHHVMGGQVGCQPQSAESAVIKRHQSTVQAFTVEFGLSSLMRSSTDSLDTFP